MDLNPLENHLLLGISELIKGVLEVWPHISSKLSANNDVFFMRVILGLALEYFNGTVKNQKLANTVDGEGLQMFWSKWE